MQTSPVQNQASVLPGPAPAARQSDGNSSVTPFDRMLSREIADRNNASESQKAPESNGASAAAKQPAAAASKAQDAKSASKDKSKEDSDATGDASTSTSVNAAPQAPADMLALVANLNQANPAAAGARDAKAAVEGDPALAALTTKTSRTGVIADDVRAKAVDGDGKAGKPDPNAINASAKPAADLVADEGGAADTAVASASAKPGFEAEIKESLANATAIQPAPQAALQAAQPVVAHLQDKLTPTVGTPAWDQALGQKVVWMVAGEHQSASLTLNPPDLGPLQVVLNVSHSTATATFSAAQPEVRQALEAALPKLREMLGDAGIQLGQASVNSGAANQQGTADRHAAHSAQRTGHADSASEAPVRIGRVQPAASGRGLVDTFV
jgi:flagellar hook-length control protein FliK